MGGGRLVPGDHASELCGGGTAESNMEGGGGELVRGEGGCYCFLGARGWEREDAVALSGRQRRYPDQSGGRPAIMAVGSVRVVLAQLTRSQGAARGEGIAEQTRGADEAAGARRKQLGRSEVDVGRGEETGMAAASAAYRGRWTRCGAAGRREREGGA